MRSILENEDRFFEIVQTTPDLLEADGMIRDALASVKLEMGEAALMCSAVGTARMTQLGALRDKLKAELHRINQINESVKWSHAVKAVCGDEAYRDCVIWMRSMGGII
ncbi:MAG: hypothetical protein K5804_17760 [Microbacterium sp.]|uniref:hypothetical protein n=1 Tax=Microbacterium sp. TaxID=51671 RepID=UPI002613CCB9|nr:hypothetical protein [Microbacterium sp.]MCV0420091.1 hypothetical protein [Microbacterium sp.]